jgi:NAD(P)-dependent dehydrogenase (short-subunit alcohol dehydrogenase family)
MVAYATIESFRLDGQVSLVTAASRGLGKAIAEALAGAGPRCCFDWKADENADAIGTQLAKRLGGALYLLKWIWETSRASALRSKPSYRNLDA